MDKIKNIYEVLDHHQNIDEYICEVAKFCHIDHIDIHFSIETQFDFSAEYTPEDTKKIYAEYIEHVFLQDSRYQTMQQQQIPIYQPFTNDIVLSKEQRKKSIVWDYLTRIQLVNQVMFNGSIDGLIGGMAYSRFGSKEGLFSDNDIAQITFANKILHDRIKLHKTMLQNGFLYESYEKYMENHHAAVIIIDVVGKVIHFNNQAIKFVHESQLYSIYLQKFFFKDSNIQKQFNYLLAEIQKNDIADYNTSYLAQYIDKNNHEQYANIRIFRIPSYHNLLTHNAKIAIIIEDKSVTKSLSYSDLKKQFNISKAEFKIIEQILMGRNLSEMSEYRNVSYETVRTQSKSILSKCNCHTQKELLVFLQKFLI